MHAETARVFPETLRSASSKKEDWAAVSGSERIAPHSQDQSRVEAYTTGFSQASIFIPSPFIIIIIIILRIPQQRESFSLIEGVSTDRYKSVEAQLLCMWDGAI